MVSIGIQNNGISISEEQQQLPFAMSANVSTKGTNIKKKVVWVLFYIVNLQRKMEIKYGIESTTNKGITFYFTLKKE